MDLTQVESLRGQPCDECGDVIDPLKTRRSPMGVIFEKDDGSPDIRRFCHAAHAKAYLDRLNLAES